MMGQDGAVSERTNTRRLKGAKRDCEFESLHLRQPVCTVYLQYGDGRKQARTAALLRFEANQRKLVPADQPNCAGGFSARRKAGSLQESGRAVHRVMSERRSHMAKNSAARR